MTEFENKNPLRESICKLKAVADLLGQTAENRTLRPETMPWISILMQEELDRMDTNIAKMNNTPINPN